MESTSHTQNSAPLAPALSSHSSKKFVIFLFIAMLAFSIALMVYTWSIRVPAQPGMLYVPEGSFKAGSDAKTTSLKAYYIDETEVSNADFAAFCRATGCLVPAGAPDLPIVNVTFRQAEAFANWKGKRLPTALEWERMARGIDGHRYPWGNAADASHANLADNQKLASHQLMPVKSFDPVPIYQMEGNAWEIIDADAAPDAADSVKFAALLTPPPTPREKWIQIRGGSFQTPVADAVTYQWRAIPVRYAAADIGFRCAKTP